MKSEYRSVVAIAVSAAFMMLWFYYFNPPKKNAPAENTQQTVEQAQPAQTAQTEKNEAHGTKDASSSATSDERRATEVKDPQSNLPIKTTTLRNGKVEIELTTDGAIASSWLMSDYRKTTDKNSPAIDLATNSPDTMPTLELSFSDANFSFPARPRFELVEADDSHAVFKWRSSEVEIKKMISLDKEKYLADVAVDVKNLKNDVIKGRPSISWGSIIEPQKKGGFFAFLGGPQADIPQIVYFLDGKVYRETNSANLAASTTKEGSIYWSGIESRYFLGALIPRVQGQGLSTTYGASEIKDTALPQGSRSVFTSAALPSMSIPTSGSSEALFSVYAGPKDIAQLKSIGVRLDEAIDYGWFTVIAVPILYLLKFFYGIINNYGIAIILLTIFVKLLLHPINVKSLKSMKAMQQLQPQIKLLQEKFKNDKQRLNQETMQLFRSHKVNPMGGCLPMLLQFPIYIALYKVLWNSIELFHAPFFWFYRDLSAPDPYLITPILLGIFMVAQQKLMPSTSADPTQKKMMMIMPVMFSVFMLFLPVGLVVYILVNTVMSVTQQWMYNKGIRMRDLIRGKWKPAGA